MKEIKMEKLTKEMYQELLSDEITRKREKEILEMIDDRVDHLMRNVLTTMNNATLWWDYDNEGGRDGEPGYFDHLRYKREIFISGEYYPKYPLTQGEFISNFPTEYLWTPDEKIIEELERREAKEKAKIQAKEDRAKKAKKEKKKIESGRKERLPEIIKSVKSKLTEEEMSYISFGFKIKTKVSK